jgi:hypothetical protein
VAASALPVRPQMDLDRIRYLLASYFRTRLTKVRTSSRYCWVRLAYSRALLRVFPSDQSLHILLGVGDGNCQVTVVARRTSLRAEVFKTKNRSLQSCGVGCCGYFGSFSAVERPCHWCVCFVAPLFKVCICPLSIPCSCYSASPPDLQQWVFCRVLEDVGDFFPLTEYAGFLIKLSCW